MSNVPHSDAPLKIMGEIVYYRGEILTMGQYNEMNQQERQAVLSSLPPVSTDRTRFSKTHYEAIAAVLREIGGHMEALHIHHKLRDEIVEMATARFALMLAKDNQAFDSFRFKDAVIKPPVGAARRGTADGANSTRAKFTAR